MMTSCANKMNTNRNKITSMNSGAPLVHGNSLRLVIRPKRITRHQVKIEIVELQNASDEVGPSVARSAHMHVHVHLRSRNQG